MIQKGIQSHKHLKEKNNNNNNNNKKQNKNCSSRIEIYKW